MPAHVTLHQPYASFERRPGAWTISRRRRSCSTMDNNRACSSRSSARPVHPKSECSWRTCRLDRQSVQQQPLHAMTRIGLAVVDRLEFFHADLQTMLAGRWTDDAQVHV